MKILIDACVLFPTVMREIVLKTAEAGFFEPYWSARILEEWRRGVAKLGDGQVVVAEGEIAVLRSKWPDAEVPDDPELEAQLYLPDPADCHVLASAINCDADVLMTLNLKDFPRQTLVEYGLLAKHPDEILRGFFDKDEAVMREIAYSVHAEAERLSGEKLPFRKLMKRARLPRLGKATEV